MNFASGEWLAWMAGAVSAYWLAPARWRDLLLVAVTAAFLAVNSPISLGVLAAMTGIAWQAARPQPLATWRAAGASALVLALLVYFKVEAFVESGELLQDVAIPIGMSYYSFRCVHYIIERYREEIDEHSFVDLLCYLWFLPTLVIGPINRAQPFLDDRRTKSWNTGDLSYGLERIVYGYAKIVILGFWLINGQLSDYIASIPDTNSSWKLYVDMVRDFLLLYVLFAGASDVAIGFGRLLGYKIMENFTAPLLAENISEFWRRWHISLSSWCRDYIYFPVLGATRNPYAATLASFAAIGLWHEISYRYILWGIWHGAGILVWRRWQGWKRQLGIPGGRPWPRRLLSMLLTFHYCIFGFVIVNQPDLPAVGTVLGAVLFGWAP
jgi:alginate O-acetyltransferase complex protein AlgI